ncbi:MAG TPA: hypothetical protein VFQ50_00315 [Flavobacterium sp.]|jgi:hypothetical protein|nr:hypothetical protein [Flavobacterium sp.]
MTIKHKIHAHYQQLLQDRIDVFRDMIAALSEDSKNDAKGSAGDKHETALSMMHIEQEKLNRKLSEIYQQKEVVDKINPESLSEYISLGSLVTANGMLLYISAALPKATIDNQTIIAVSPQSPLGAKLMGNRAGFTFEINGTAYIVSEVQ